MNISIIQIVFILIGSIIGAGFASGAEIYIFFAKYGSIGILGIITSNILTSLIIYKSLKIINKYKINSFNDFLTVQTNTRNNILINSFSLIINIYIYLSFVIMVSGFATFFNEMYNINKFFSIIILDVICFYLFNKNVSYIIKINFYLIPFLILIIVYFSVHGINIKFNSVECTNLHWLLSSILYSSYNSILLIPILISLKKLIINLKKHDIQEIAFIIFLILTILAVSVINLLFSIDNYNAEIPMIQVTRNMGNNYYYIYGFIITIAIFTSAIASGYSFINIFKNNKNFKCITALVCFSTLIFSNIDFSKLVSLLYPIFGFLGIMLILLMLGIVKRPVNRDVLK